MVELLDELAEKHNRLAAVLESITDARYADACNSLAQAERLSAATCQSLACSIRAGHRPKANNATRSENVSAALK